MQSPVIEIGDDFKIENKYLSFVSLNLGSTQLCIVTRWRRFDFAMTHISPRPQRK